MCIDLKNKKNRRRKETFISFREQTTQAMLSRMEERCYCLKMNLWLTTFEAVVVAGEGWLEYWFRSADDWTLSRRLHRILKSYEQMEGFFQRTLWVGLNL